MRTPTPTLTRHSPALTMGSRLSGLSIFHPQGYLNRPTNPFGKDIANAALFRGLLEHGGFSKFAILNQLSLSSEQIISSLDSPHSALITSAPLYNTSYPAEFGTLLRGQPYLSELAWLRRHDCLDHSYSLVGLIHTIAPPAVRQEISASLLAPTYEWDALVCTSPAVQRSMTSMFEALVEHYSSRFGASKAPRPSLPLIPLAVDVDQLHFARGDSHARDALRRRLSIPADDVLVLWVGRLSYYEKAFPQSMFQSLQIASRKSNHKLHFLLVGWFPGGETELKLYEQAANILAPDLNVIVMDGNDPSVVAQSWAAADIFFSLVDNIQETFGLTPVEAMAAGLPVVVSDWDGYRYTVRDGIDGFLVPTICCSDSPLGGWMANMHALGLETYQNYVGATAQHTAVNVEIAASALIALANNPQQRIEMGLAGKQRARSEFSWVQVSRQYRELFEELSSKRLSADNNEKTVLTVKVNPCRGEPFADFRHFATTALGSKTCLRLVPGVRPSDLNHRLTVDLNNFYSGLRVSSQETFLLLEALESAGSDGLATEDLCVLLDEERRPLLETTLVWLVKMHLVELRPVDFAVTGVAANTQ